MRGVVRGDPVHQNGGHCRDIESLIHSGPGTGSKAEAAKGNPLGHGLVFPNVDPEAQKGPLGAENRLFGVPQL